METKEEIKRYINDVKDLPLWLKYTLAILTIYSILSSSYFKFKSPELNKEILSNPVSDNATTTISILDVFNKANVLDSVLERQDFLKKYIGSRIYGKGPVTEVSRSSNGYLVDIRVGGQLVTCDLIGNEENERRIPLLKGKTISFSGVFTMIQIFGHDGLVVDGCSF